MAVRPRSEEKLRTGSLNAPNGNFISAWSLWRIKIRTEVHYGVRIVQASCITWLTIWWCSASDVGIWDGQALLVDPSLFRWRFATNASASRSRVPIEAWVRITGVLGSLKRTQQLCRRAREIWNPSRTKHDL